MNGSKMVRAAAAAALMLGAASAEAQVTFYTQGFFTSAFAGCNDAVPVAGAPVGATCAGGGFLLRYDPTTSAGPIANGSVVSLGNFRLTGTGDVTVPANQVEFTLRVYQMTPTMGSGDFIGFINGTVTTDPAGDFSSIRWTPNQFVNISPVTYQLVFDNIGPAAGVGLAIPINDERGIQALVTVSSVPEPSTYALMATGLLGIFGLARRRQNQA